MFVEFINELLETSSAVEFKSKLLSMLGESTAAHYAVIPAKASVLRWTNSELTDNDITDDVLLAKLCRYLFRLNARTKKCTLYKVSSVENNKFRTAMQAFNSKEAIVFNDFNLVILGSELSKIDLKSIDELLSLALKIQPNNTTLDTSRSKEAGVNRDNTKSAASEMPSIGFDKLGRVNFVSNKYLSMFGLKKKKIMQMHFSDLIQEIVIEPEREEVSNYYWSVYEKRNSKIECKSYLVKNKKGEEFLVADSFYYNKDEFVSSLVPFSDLDKKEKSNKIDERYRRLVENSDAIIFHVDSLHRISFISQRALDFFGVAAEDFLVGQKVEWFDLIHVDDRKQVRASARKAAKKVDGFDEELRVVNHLTGRIRWLLVKLVPVQAQNGKISGWDAFGVDISVRKEALKELDAKRLAYKNQAKKLSALYKVSHELSGFLTTNEIFSKSFDIIKAELGFKRLWVGLLDDTGTRVVGQAAYGPNWKKHLVEIDLQLSDASHPISRVVNSRSPLVINSSSELLGDGNIRKFFSKFDIESVGLIPLIAGGQVLGVLAFQPESEDSTIDNDVITLISSLAAEIAANLLTKRLEVKAGETDKMKAAGLLAAGVAHNFNNLLQAILGQSSLLKMLETESEDVKQAASIINDAAFKGAGLVRQLMSFSNIENPKLIPLDINLLLERSEIAFKRNLKAEQKLILNLRDKLPKALIDSRQVLRIINTLLLNAKEAMHEQGTVSINTQYFKISETSAHFEVPIGNYIRVTVEDDGKGMNEETKKRCFEPFYSTKNIDSSSGIAFAGAGLGLAAAYALAKKNNGVLTVESGLGKGTKFSLYLPENKIEQSSKKVNR